MPLLDAATQTYDSPGTTNDAKTIPVATTVAVCCTSCYPPSRFSKTLSNTLALFRKQKYYDAEQAPLDRAFVAKDDWKWENESQFFFDAEQEPLGDEEYPITFTNYITHPKPSVSLDAPASMLRRDSRIHFAEFEQDVAMSEHGTSAWPAKQQLQKNDLRRQFSAPISDHRRRSQRFDQLISRSTLEKQTALEEPRVKIPLRGYPGDLTLDELAECQKFLRGLKAMDPAVSEQVYSFRDIEEEPYTICRWLRATKFDADAILKRLKENQPMFEEARNDNFYPDVSEALGVPFSVFLSQYPFLPIGHAKNKCPVNYFLAGKINPEGILSLTTQEKLTGYFWWSFMFKFKHEIRNAQAADPDFVRVEGVNVLDLQGLSASALSGETMDVIKLASKISDFFPETLHCMLIINAPGFFSMFWGLIRKFIDPRTAQRIQVFSNKEKAMNALRKMIDIDQIPVDYGGTNKSIKQAFLEEAEDPLLKGQDIELIHVKRKCRVGANREWTLAADEYMEIRVYTRSISAANVTVEFNGEVYARKAAKCLWENVSTPTGSSRALPASPASTSSASQHTPSPKCTVIVEALQGPGTVRVDFLDLDSAYKQSDNTASRGYFLLVCDIKVTSTTTTAGDSSGGGMENPATHEE